MKSDIVNDFKNLLETETTNKFKIKGEEIIVTLGDGTQAKIKTKKIV